tara:strand:+ start:1288 stop:1467 length:180 start_codon:yes stop_codon:yes gene_type:complete
MKEKIQVPEGYGSCYPVSHWGVQPQAPAEPQEIEEVKEEIKPSLLQRFKTIFKGSTDEK